MNTHYFGLHAPMYPGPIPVGPMPMGHPGLMGPPLHPTYHGFCPVCYHPLPLCVCGFRECRKEAKELLVTPQERTKDVGAMALLSLFAMARAPLSAEETAEEEEAGAAGVAAARLAAVAKRFEAAEQQLGQDDAYIGGGCCVHLSIEYTSTSQESAVLVLVTDSESTILGWAKAGMKPGYYIKECIISTNPGAKLQVVVANVTARVRWCEVFSC